MKTAKQDYSSNWGALLDMFISASGLKLRINMLDTILLAGGRITTYFYTNKDGVVCKFSAHEITRSFVYQRLAVQHGVDPLRNPFGYIALAHFPSGISRLLKRNELQELLKAVHGPFEFSEDSSHDLDELPFCLQSYVVPARDQRYITSFSDSDGPQIAVIARRFTTRYTHAFDSPAALMEQVSEAGSVDGSACGPMSSEEMLVESQLVAMGLLEPRQGVGGGGLGGGEREARQSTASHTSAFSADGHDPGEFGGSSEPVIHPSKRIRSEACRTLQTISSYVERAHGTRITGLVAEFIPLGPEALCLLAIHAVQLDPKGSRGRLGTFTERWADYLAGMGPPPAPQPITPLRGAQAPSMLRSADSALVMTDRSSGQLVRTPGAGGASTPAAPAASSVPLLSPATSMQLGGPFTHSQSATGISLSHVPAHRVDSGYGLRPNSAPTAQVIKMSRAAGAAGLPNSLHSSYQNGHYTLRNAMSAARAGAGGNPTASPPIPNSYNLWQPQDTPAATNVTAMLALELEAVRERLQRQTDTAARAQAALTSLADSTRRQVGELSVAMEELQAKLAKESEGRRHAESEFERLRAERLEVQSGRAEVEAEVARLRLAVAADRETLTLAMRNNSTREEALESQLRAAREERDDALQQLSVVQRRLEEEREVVEAVRAQLFDYKNMVAQLQTQVRRGRNNKQLLGAAAGSTTGPAGSAGQGGAASSVGHGGGGGGGGTRGPNGRDDADSDAGSDVMTTASLGCADRAAKGMGKPSPSLRR